MDRPHDVAVPSFLSLPRELRDMIYHLVLGEEAEYCQSRECHAWERDPEFNAFIHKEDLWPTCKRFNIARTCRIVYEEANQVMYRNNTFRFRVMSKTWLRPLISQRNADIMQNIHIVLGSDKLSRTRSVQFLRMFTSSQIGRKECRIELDLDSPKDVKIMPPIFQVLKGLTGFEVVIVEITEKGRSIRPWLSPEYVQARTLWRKMRQDLESALGAYEYARGVSCFQHLEFKPREHLAQNSLSP